MTRLFPFLLLLLLSSCARQGAPTGGPKDTTPPRVDSLTSTPNYATRFQEKKIELRFDEWVTLSEVATQVVVSPPLRTKRVPDISLKGKTVVVEIPENDTLRPNTTYALIVTDQVPVAGSHAAMPHDNVPPAVVKLPAMTSRGVAGPEPSGSHDVQSITSPVAPVK